MEVTLITPSEVRTIFQEELIKFRESLTLTNPNIQDQDERITRQELAKLYKISLPTVHQCMKQGLPYEKVGRKTLFKRSEADAFFNLRKRIL